MNATVEIKGMVLTIDKFVKWEDDHEKYEGCVYMTSDKGAEYMGFVHKDRSSVSVIYINKFSNKSYGKGVVKNLVIKPSRSEKELLEKAIMDKFAIDAKVLILDEGISIGLQTHQSAFALFKAFRRHGPILKADSFLDFNIFIPRATSQTLLLNQK